MTAGIRMKAEASVHAVMQIDRMCKTSALIESMTVWKQIAPTQALEEQIKAAEMLDEDSRHLLVEILNDPLSWEVL